MAAKPKQIVEAVMDFTPRPTVDGVLDHFILNAGGQAAFGKMLFDEFTAAAPGSMIRAKVFELVLRRMEKSEERNRGADLADMTDEDIANALAGREKAMLTQIPENESHDSNEEPKRDKE